MPAALKNNPLLLANIVSEPEQDNMEGRNPSTMSMRGRWMAPFLLRSQRFWATIDCCLLIFFVHTTYNIA